MKKIKGIAMILSLAMVLMAGCGKNNSSVQTEAKGKTNTVFKEVSVGERVESVSEETGLKEADTIEGTYGLKEIQIPKVMEDTEVTTDRMNDFEMWCDRSAVFSYKRDEWNPEAGHFVADDTKHEDELNTYDNRRALLEECISLFNDCKLSVNGEKMKLSHLCSLLGEQEFEFDYQMDGDNIIAIVKDPEKPDKNIGKIEGSYDAAQGTICIDLLEEDGTLAIRELYAKDAEPVSVDDSEESVYGEYVFAADGKWMTALREKGVVDELDYAAGIDLWKTANPKLTISPGGEAVISATFEGEENLVGTYNKAGRTIDFGGGPEGYYFAGKFYVVDMEIPGGVLIFEK